MNEDGGDVRQHTRHSGWDVKNPDLDSGRIVAQTGTNLGEPTAAGGQAKGRRWGHELHGGGKPHLECAGAGAFQ